MDARYIRLSTLIAVADGQDDSPMCHISIILNLSATLEELLRSGFVMSSILGNISLIERQFPFVHITNFTILKSYTCIQDVSLVS